MIEDLCLDIANKVLNQLEMPSPNRSVAASFDVELRRDQSYNSGDLLSYVQSNIPNLTLERKVIYNQIIQTVNNELGEIFLDDPARTCQTFLIRLILAAFRSQNGIALAFASSGIGATLLPGGRTATSAVKMSLNMQFIETPKRNISRAFGTRTSTKHTSTRSIIQSNIQREAGTYKSVDTVKEVDEAVNYQAEFFNSLDLPEIPSHVHQLEIGVPIIMLRNINKTKLCNAMRLAVKY
ncbi:uncharacterized protein [Procambarus clarkii]|uniref:uncharacterized protein n=1 Tax=Procambarus clarkii TaxID=6728 RepID=UPI003744232B